MSDSIASLLDLLTEESDDELTRVLLDARIALLKHPVAARAAFRALVAEGRRYAETDAGQAYKRRLAGSDLVRKTQPVWEIASLGMFEERSERVLPSQYIDALCYAAGLADLEPVLAQALEPRERDDEGEEDVA